jgi:hypothetical protein
MAAATTAIHADNVTGATRCAINEEPNEIRNYYDERRSRVPIPKFAPFRGTLGCALRRSFEKARPYIEKCAHYSDSSMQFTLGAVYRVDDFVFSWARYNISRHLGSKDAIERLSSLEELPTKKEAERALEQSQKIEANLKPTLCNIALQGPKPDLAARRGRGA